MPNSPTLLPTPRHLTLSSGTFTLPAHALILLDDPNPPALHFTALRLQRALPAEVKWEITAIRSAPREQVALTMRLAPDRAPRPQGYELTITTDGITLEAHDAPGLFYGVCTLIQLIQPPTSNLQLPISNLQPTTPQPPHIRLA